MTDPRIPVTDPRITPLAEPMLWPITNTLVHTRGNKTEVAVYGLEPEKAVLTLRFGGASDVTVHVQNIEEIRGIHRQLGFALDALEKERGGR